MEEEMASAYQRFESVIENTPNVVWCPAAQSDPNATWMQRWLKERMGIDTELVLGGVNPAVFYPVDTPKDPSRVAVLCSGDPRPRKGTADVVEAFRRAAQEECWTVCDQETRICTDGVLSGSYAATACFVTNCDDSIACTFDECIDNKTTTWGCRFSPDDGACDDDMMELAGRLMLRFSKTDGKTERTISYRSGDKTGSFTATKPLPEEEVDRMWLR